MTDTEMTDTEILDFLDSLTLPDSQVILRKSTTGGGWRMHDVEGFFYVGFPTVREAIKAYKMKYNDD